MSLWPLLGGSAALEGIGGLMGARDAKRDYKHRRGLWQGALAGVDLAGSQGRQDVAETFGAQQAGLANRLNERNLTGSTAYDAALNANLGNRQRAMSRVNNETAARRAEILGQAPTPPGGSGAGLWSGLSGLLGQGATMQHQGDIAGRLAGALGGGGGEGMRPGGGGGWGQFLGGGGGGPSFAGESGQFDKMATEQVRGNDTRARLKGRGDLWSWFQGLMS